MCFLSIFGGSLLIWLIFPFNYLIVLPFYLKLLTLVICIIGGLLGYFINSLYNFYILFFNKYIILIKIFFSLIWFLPFLRIYNNFFFLNIGYYYLKIFEFGWGEFFGRLNLYKFLINLITYINLIFFLKFLNNFFFNIFILLILIFIFK